jgi:hypothetical protein
MDQERVWEEILLLIENRMSKQGYDTWFSQSKLSIDGNKLQIEVPANSGTDCITGAPSDDQGSETEDGDRLRPAPARGVKPARQTKDARGGSPRKNTPSLRVAGSTSPCRAKAVADAPGHTTPMGLGKTTWWVITSRVSPRTVTVHERTH